MLRMINFKNPLVNSRSYLTLIKLTESRGYRELYFTITKLTPHNKLTAADMPVTLCYKCSATNALLKSLRQALIQAPSKLSLITNS